MNTLVSICIVFKHSLHMFIILTVYGI